MEQADYSFFLSLAEFSFLEAGMGDICACSAPEGFRLAFDLQLVSWAFLCSQINYFLNTMFKHTHTPKKTKYPLCPSP